MKTSALSIVLVSSALLLAPLPATPTPDTPYGVRIDQIARSQSAEIRPGITEFTVVRYLGSAHRRLSRDVWLYHNFFADSDEANRRGCNKLVLTFTNGRLTDLKIVNAAAVKLIAADIKRQHDALRLAGK